MNLWISERSTRGGKSQKVARSSRPDQRRGDIRRKHTHCLSVIIFLVIGLLWGFPLLISRNARAATEEDQLLVFQQGGASPVDRTFLEDQLPKIRNLAEMMGVSVHLIDARKGAPKAITVTPLIVYQNHRGRSIYQGRTTTPDRIRNFIRTSRFIPQGDALNRREHIPVWEIERARIWAPIKITHLTGSIPQNYNHEVFVSEATAGIAAGFEKFHFLDRIDLGRADRGFYMDFYPYRSEDGILYLSLALFSQFNCKEPVFVKKVQGPWRDRNGVFNQGAAALEAAVFQVIRDPHSGDSFDPVPENIPNRTWEEIGFPLPPAPEKKEVQPLALAEIPRHWTYEKPGSMDPPLIQFRFPPPLDSYAGEVKTASGEFNLPGSHRLDDARGFIEIDTRSAITMGNEVLDEVIRGSMILDAKNYPKASYVITSIDSSGQRIAFDRLFPASISGIFTLKGKSMPLTCPAEFELVIGEEDMPRLLIRTAFRIDLRIFNIEEADGPAPARHTLLFDVNFLLKERKTG